MIRYLSYNHFIHYVDIPMILMNVILENTCGGFNPMAWIIEMVLHLAHLLKDEQKTCCVQQARFTKFIPDINEEC